MKPKNNRLFSSAAIITAAVVVTSILLLSTWSQTASAHERTLFTIGENDYLFVIGSIDEPVFVDDKSGVDLAVYSPDPDDPMNSGANQTQPIEGLEEVLQVEIIAGDQQRVFNLESAFMQPGSYEAVFFPAVQTTYSYRVFGNINGTDFDYTWTCSPAGEIALPANTTAVEEISENVTLHEQAGAFGCPESRAEVAFPESYVSNQEIVARLQQLEQQVGNATAQ